MENKKLELKHSNYAVDKGVATITLSRPERLNAFTPRMMDELLGLFEQVDRDDSVRAVVVTGEGRAFCAGADLSTGGSTFDSEAHGETGGLDAHRDGGGRVTLAIHRCRKPVHEGSDVSIVGFVRRDRVPVLF